MRKFLASTLCLFVLLAHDRSFAMSLSDAARRAVKTNPAIAGAQANKTATDFELQQAYGRLYPEIDISAEAGPQVVDKPNSLGPEDNLKGRLRLQSTLTVRQHLFDGFDRRNDIYRAESRVDAASLRILERSEIIVLSAVEAYIDTRRHARLLRRAKSSVRRHREILSLLQIRQRGGKAPVSDVDQAKERLSAAEAIVVDIKLALSRSKATFERVVGVRPSGLHGVAVPKGLPGSKQQAIDIALASNKSINVAQADISIAEAEEAQSHSAFYPQVSIEGNAVLGHNLDGVRGRNNDYNGKIVVRWRLFDGRIRDARTAELRARVSQREAERRDRMRQATEAIDRAWSSFRIGRERARILAKQTRVNNKVVKTYLEEYKLSKRSLLDLLDAENTKFRSRFDLINAQAISLFAAYELLATMGRLLDHFSISPHQPEMSDTTRRGLFGLTSSPGLTIPSLRSN